ncbi:uncharacterized protein KY384_008885 [Bacidia gigantensis]|uniref:uncharacterized protein n=1 Tax=Bacidia gigantensis TaxID=2732470 RepID=UPI001D047720|nr:uncharacterized protein KY384_008885 [Bacidia gigantensis]KAG8525241.1 hypothetical protein KY384_008885 [Bacidia gigantensis]
MAIKVGSDGSTISDAEKQALKAALRGDVHFRAGVSTEDYDQLLRRWNEAFTEQANIVALVESEQDVSECIKFAKEHDIDIAVAGGRHSYHGSSSTTGMVIGEIKQPQNSTRCADDCQDLRKLNKVTIDKASKTVTGGGGCVAGDLEKPAEAEGLSVVFGAINETGIGGLTTGGGAGWLTGRHGLTIDNLLAARVVLANGELVIASEQENEDLFWGIRGGGSNFGICTEFTFRAHDQGLCFFQMLTFAPDKLKDCISLIDKIHTNMTEPANGRFQPMFVMMAPPGKPHCPGFMVFYDGPEEEARKIAEPMYSLGPVNTMGGVWPYTQVTGIYGMMKMQGFDRWGSSSVHLDYPVNQAIVLGCVARFQEAVQRQGADFAHSTFILDLRDYRKVASVSSSATAYAGRYTAAILIADFRWDKPELDKTAREEAKSITNYAKEQVKEQRIFAKTQEDGQRDLSSFYPNVSAGTEKIESVFGSNLPRLKELKQKYDRDFLFNKWYPIDPN